MSAETLADLARVIPWVQNGKNPALTLDPARAQLLLEALERARVVGVLDAWVKAGRKRWITTYDTHLAGVELGDGDELGTVQPKFEAATLDAARAAAARAIEAGEV